MNPEQKIGEQVADKLSPEEISGAQAESPQNEDERRKNLEFEQQIEDSAKQVAELGQIRVFNREGKMLFQGDSEQLLTFWRNRDYGSIDDIANISDSEGGTIARFGPTDGRGFLSRQRIESVFQSIGGEVVAKKGAAESTQRLRETRAALGAAEAPPIVSEVRQQTSPERVIKKEKNTFDDEKASEVIAVMKDWAKYGGKLYDHLTGKDPRLERGVDWQMNPDGTANLESYRAAVRARGEAWLSDPKNEKWFEDFDKFHRDHQHEMSEEKVVRVKNADGTFSEKEKRTAPYLYQEGWLYYESNYFDEQKGEMTQPEREKSKYRAYINVGSEDIVQTFGDIIKELSSDPELIRLGFQIKTADTRISENVPVDKSKPQGEQRPATEEEKRAEKSSFAMNVMNQKDRIVMYFGERGMERAVPILQRYAEQNRSKFEKKGVLLSQMLKDSKGQEIPGISITSETKGKSPDPTEYISEYKSFSDMQDKVLQSSLRSLKAALANPKTLEGVGTNYPQVKVRLENLKPNVSTEDFVRAVLADAEGEAFLAKQVKAIYPQWAKAFGMSENNTAFKKGSEVETKESNSTSLAVESETANPKRERWEQVSQEIEHITDATGRGIDEGIKETVVAFNVNEIPTSQSCEGHEEVEGGHRPWPWVEVAASDEPEERFVGENEAFVKAATENNVPLDELKKGHPEDIYWKLREEVSKNPLTPEYQAWEQKNRELHSNVNELLAEFYKTRKAEAGIKLEVEDTEGGSFEIGSEKEMLNRFLSDELTDEEKRSLLEKLPARRKEMQDFTEFLRNRFLGSEAENRESRENPIETLQSSSLETIKKYDLAQLLLDRKQATQLGSFDVIESDEHRKQLEREMGEEYRAATELLQKLGLKFQGEPPKEDNGIYGFSLTIAKTEENLNKAVEADKAGKDKEYGVLMGYPKTAVEAYQTEEAYDLETELPKDELEKLEEEGVLAFLEFMPSKSHWKEELDFVRETQKEIKEKASELHDEIIEARRKQREESREYDIPADAQMLVEYAKAQFGRFAESDSKSFKELWTDADQDHFKQYMDVSIRTMLKDASGAEAGEDRVKDLCRTTEEKIILQRLMTESGSAMSLEEFDKQPFSKAVRETLGINVEETEGNYYKHFERTQ